MGRRFFNVKRRKRNAYDRYDSNREKYNQNDESRRNDGQRLAGNLRICNPAGYLQMENGTAMPTVDNLVILAVTLGCVIFLLFRKYSLYIANKRYRGNYFFLLFLK